MAKELAERVRNTAVQQTNGDGEAPTLRQLIERMKPEIGKALPKHMDPDRIARIAITLVGGNRQLAECTPESFLGALMTASQLGLEPGPLGEAYLVPFGNKVTFIAGYRGLIKLAFQSEQLKRIGAHIVRANDQFDFGYGLDPYLTHKPSLTDRGDPIAVYAAAKLVNDETPFVVMSIDEVERIRARSRAATKGPWVTDWDAMARKTAVRQLAKWLPMSTDRAGFSTAVALDGSTRNDPTGAVDEHIPYIDGTLEEPAALPAAAEPPAPGPTAPTMPAQPPEPAAPSPDAPAASTSTDQRAPAELVAKLKTQLTKIGVTAPAEQIHVLGQAVGHKIRTSGDVTTAEATVAAELFNRAAVQDEPGRALDALLAELENERGGGSA